VVLLNVGNPLGIFVKTEIEEKDNI